MAKRKPARAQRPPKSAKKSRSQKAKTARSRPARAAGGARSAKTARKAKKAKKKVGRRPARRSAKKARKAAASTRRASTRRAAARKSASRLTAKKASRPSAAKKAAKKTVVRKTAKSAKRTAKVGSRAKHPPTLDRTRRIAAEAEMFPPLPSSLDLDRHPSAARSGREELRERLHEHTSTGPSMTAGDIDADWEAAESVGDEAPGGDNPTPDQDVVDEIGRALGVEYDDNEELKGGEKIGARDKHRWELDPASSDDYEDRE